MSWGGRFWWGREINSSLYPLTVSRTQRLFVILCQFDMKCCSLAPTGRCTSCWLFPSLCLVKCKGGVYEECLVPPLLGSLVCPGSGSVACVLVGCFAVRSHGCKVGRPTSWTLCSVLYTECTAEDSCPACLCTWQGGGPFEKKNGMFVDQTSWRRPLSCASLLWKQP